MTPLLSIAVTPMGAVRQTQRDKWKKRPCVVAYRAFRDAVRYQSTNFTMPESHYWIVFHMPMPDSWSRTKRNAMRGQPHQQKPDKDNLEKAFLDALLGEDCRVWHGGVEKRWSDKGRIELYAIETPARVEVAQA